MSGRGSAVGPSRSKTAVVNRGIERSSPELAAGEGWLSFCEDGGEPFLVVVRRCRDLLQAGLVRQVLGKVRQHGPVERALGQSDCSGRQRGVSLGYCRRDDLQLFVRHYLADETNCERLIRA